MKKIQPNQQQLRLKLGRVTVRPLTEGELRRAAGGLWSAECSDWSICGGGPVPQAR